jgi:hypothetical protein
MELMPVLWLQLLSRAMRFRIPDEDALFPVFIRIYTLFSRYPLKELFMVFFRLFRKGASSFHCTKQHAASALSYPKFMFSVYYISEIYNARATLINLSPRQLRWRISVALRSKLVSLRKCVNKVDIRIKVTLIASTMLTNAHSHKSVLP